MTRKTLFTLASLVAAGAMLGGLAAQAQQQAPQAAPSTPKDAGPPPGGGAPSPEGNRPFPVMFVTSVELIRSEKTGGMDIVRARGLVSSSAWGEPHLLPITRGEGIDGMLDLIFQASAPSDMAPLGPFMQVEAILPIAHGHPYKGIRVRSGYNAVSLKTLPGFVEVAPPKEDCASTSRPRALPPRPARLPAMS